MGSRSFRDELSEVEQREQGCRNKEVTFFRFFNHSRIGSTSLTSAPYLKIGKGADKPAIVISQLKSCSKIHIPVIVHVKKIQAVINTASEISSIS